MPPARNHVEPTVIELAEAVFDSFSAAEKELFEVLQNGRAASAAAPITADEEDLRKKKWQSSRIIRAKCLAWLCTDVEASKFAANRGVELREVKIEGDLDFRHTKIKFSVRAERCVFAGSILAQRAEVGGLYFSKCWFQNPNSKEELFVALDAEGAKISGGLWLRDRCVVDGEVNLLGATVEAEFDCSDAEFIGHGSGDITADGMKVAGDVLLIGCKFVGPVRFLGAGIGGDLSCTEASLSKKGDAFNGDGMTVEGDLLFDAGFRSQGLVSFNAAKIGGNLDCIDSRFASLVVTDVALQAEEVEVSGNVLFNSFTAAGGVNLSRAVIGGNLECEDADLQNPEDALMADAVRVAGDLTLGEGFRAVGEVRLFDAKIGGDLDCEGARFTNRSGALSLDGAQIGADAKLTHVQASGRVGFPGAIIGGIFIFEDCEVSQEKISERQNGRDNGAEQGVAFTAEGADFKDAVYFVSGVIKGELSLIGAKIGGDLDFGGVECRAVAADAISAHRANVAGNVFFGSGFRSEGKVAFPGAKIGGDLECKRAAFSNCDGAALSLESARIERSVHFRDELEINGDVSLQNAEVRRCLDLRGLKLSNGKTLSLSSTVAGLVQDNEANWESGGQLELDGFTYERFHTDHAVPAKNWIRWIQKQPRDRFIPQPYEQLSLVLRRMGYEGHAKRVMIAKNKERARVTNIGDQGWLWYKFLGRAIGYGYAPWWAFFWSVSIIFVGFILFSLGADGLMSPTKDSAYEKDAVGHFSLDDEGNRKVSREYPAFNPFVFSVESFAPLLKLDQSANWTPNANSTKMVSLGPCLKLTGDFLRGYLYCHIILGWLLTSLWIGAITGLAKT